MKSEPQSPNSKPTRSLDECFADKPHVRQRLLEISDMIDSLVAQGCSAHEAEARAIEEIRKLGNGILTEWADKSEKAAVAKARATDPELQPYRKKKLLTWLSTYGLIRVLEQRLRQGRRGSQVRPFCVQAQIKSREYSLPLQRALSDFGAEESFVKAACRVREHYGIDVSVNAARVHTLAHAKAIGAIQHEAPRKPVKTLITEMDGCMLPIVEPSADTRTDRRKGKQLSWHEARLCCARDKEKVDCVYGATFGSASLAGVLWGQVALAAGLGDDTHVHGLGDGAPWILGTFTDQFGWGQDSQATYTIDFHHVSDYLAAASLVIKPSGNKDWLHRQQEHLLENRTGRVLHALGKHLEPPEQKEAPVRSAHGYIRERQQHMDYAGARAAGLPIGSGEVESGHRHVLQKRLKIAGAWWLKPHAEAMLQLRTVRANRDWDKYWEKISAN
jgi:hypothetical protein